MKEVHTTDASRSWFCVWNNPEKHLPELKPEEIVEKVIQMWVEDKPARSCAVNYEIGDSGTPHLHMVLEDRNKARFSALQKLFPGIHCEVTKGNKKQAMDYIYKIGAFEEKGHTIVVQPVIYGEIMAKKGRKETLLDDIGEMINNGMTPQEIMDISILYLEKDALIKKAYFAKRMKETPPIREVEVIYHVGETGSGKTYAYVQLCEKYGDDRIYLVTDHSENGAFDMYYGQERIFIDELRYMRYETLLQITQGCRAQIHCRYANSYAIWNAVDIASILPPEVLYDNIIPPDKRSGDGLDQFLRRITKVVYHYKENGEYKALEVSGRDYVNYEDLKQKVLQNEGGFMEVEKVKDYEQIEIPFLN